jgi:hypothetical protein
MNKKTILYLAIATAVVGGVIWYNRNKAKKTTLAKGNKNEPFEQEMENDEDSSNYSGQQIGSQPCSSNNPSECAGVCNSLGGTYNANGDRKCYKNGVAITGGGLFGGGLKAVRTK